MQIKPYLLSAIITLGLIQGCSFSASSGSSSTSSDSSSDSSASSSGSSASSSGDEKEYEVAIMNYTSAYLTTAEFDRYAFNKGISEIAMSNGITNWEDDEATLMGIGRALKKTGMSGNVYETYKKSLADSSQIRMQMIEKGYLQQEN